MHGRDCVPSASPTPSLLPHVARLPPAQTHYTVGFLHELQRSPGLACASWARLIRMKPDVPVEYHLAGAPPQRLLRRSRAGTLRRADSRARTHASRQAGKQRNKRASKQTSVASRTSARAAAAFLSDRRNATKPTKQTNKQSKQTNRRRGWRLLDHPAAAVPGSAHGGTLHASPQVALQGAVTTAGSALRSLRWRPLRLCAPTQHTR